MLYSTLIPNLGNGSGFIYIQDSLGNTFASYDNTEQNLQSVYVKLINGEYLDYRILFNTAGNEWNATGATDITDLFRVRDLTATTQEDTVTLEMATNSISFARVAAIQVVDITSINGGSGSGRQNLTTFTVASGTQRAGDIVVIRSTIGGYVEYPSILDGGDFKLSAPVMDFSASDRYLVLMFDGTQYNEIARSGYQSPVDYARLFSLSFPNMGATTTAVNLAGATVTLTPGTSTFYQRYTGSGVMLGNYTIQASVNPLTGDSFHIQYRATVTTSPGKKVVIFGYTLTDEEAAAGGLDILAEYVGGVWEVTTIRDFSATGQIVATDIANDAVTLAKMSAGTANRLIGYNAAGDPVEVNMSGDATIVPDTGVITIANSAVTNAKINNGSVTPSKMSDAANEDIIVMHASFETGEQGAYTVPVPTNYAGTIIRVEAFVMLALAGADAGTITFATSGGPAPSLNLSLGAASAFATTASANVAAGEGIIAGGSTITITTAKPTAGGRVNITLHIRKS